MLDESIEVAPSEDNGNVAVDAPETPSEPKETETPTETVETETPTETEETVEEELFELPDGRQVNAETLSKEWKENFMPDYTQKSQALAEKEQQINNQPTSKFDDPNYVPQSYKEIKDEAVEEALKIIEGKEQARSDERQAIEDGVANQLTELKQANPKLNENALFLHANKYGFRDLKKAHENMNDMNETIKKTQTTTAENIAKRTDPVSTSPGATGGKPDPSQFATSIDYLNSLKS